MTPSADVPPRRRGRALVLGGGGSSGNAWLIGVIAGLAEADVDVTQADVIIGTSAGSTTAVQVTSAKPAELLAAILAPAPRRQSGPPPDREGARRAQVTDQLARTNRIIADAADASDMRRRLGAAALELDAASDGAWPTRWRAIVAARLPSKDWPSQPLLTTAVDARSGEPVVFDRDSRVDLVDAVAASTSSGLPYRIGDNQYLDGGYRRNENADLAAGYDRVLVLSPFGGRSRHPPQWRMDLAAQVDDLLATGSRVETIFPDSDSEQLFGADAMDPSLRAPAALLGREQGWSLAGKLTRFW